MKKTLLALAVVAASGAAFAASTAKDLGVTIDPYAKSLGQKPSAKDFEKAVAKNADQKDHAAAQQGQKDIDKAIASAGYKAPAKKVVAFSAEKPAASIAGQKAQAKSPARGERAS
jgi:hypothetical protein